MMATARQRLQTIADTLFPGRAPVAAAELARWGEAKADAAGRLAEFSALPAEQKADMVLSILRSQQIDEIESRERPQPVAIRSNLEDEWQ